MWNGVDAFVVESAVGANNTGGAALVGTVGFRFALQLRANAAPTTYSYGMVRQNFRWGLLLQNRWGSAPITPQLCSITIQVCYKIVDKKAAA